MIWLFAGLPKMIGILVPAVFSIYFDEGFVDVLVQRASIFRSAHAEVSNWRFQAAVYLAGPQNDVALALGVSRIAMPRCVKLNNYWCVKAANWDGEFGHDIEGHVAFASAPAGAAAAALLLRRYYVDFARRSALDIVSRWAPSRCAGGVRSPITTIADIRVAASTPRRPSAVEWRAMTPAERARTADVLIARKRKEAAARSKLVANIIKRVERIDPSVLNSEMPLRDVQPRDPSFCLSEEQRVAAYARKTMVGLADLPTEDLMLFDSDGHPTWRLSKVMSNMASVEIGPQRTTSKLIEMGIAKLPNSTSEDHKSAKSQD